MQMRPPHFFHNIVNMKHYLLIIVSLFTSSASYAQFSSVSTNIVGWAAGNINAAVDLNVNLHNTINIPEAATPFKFGDTQWSHVVLQPGWRHWFVERYIGQFVSPSLFYANYTIGYDKRTFKGNAYGIGFPWCYSKLLSTRLNSIVEIGSGIIYTPYTEKLRPKYIGEFDDEYTYHHRRFLLVPIKCNLSFSYLF